MAVKALSESRNGAYTSACVRLSGHYVSSKPTHSVTAHSFLRRTHLQLFAANSQQLFPLAASLFTRRGIFRRQAPPGCAVRGIGPGNQRRYAPVCFTIAPSCPSPCPICLVFVANKRLLTLMWPVCCCLACCLATFLYYVVYL